MSRFLDRFFILHPAPDPAWSLRRRAVYAVYRLAMVLCAGLCMGLALLVLSIGPYPNDILFGYLQSWLILALNAVPVALLVLLLYGALGRAWTAFLAGGGIALGFSLGNYYKLHFRDDPLYLEDLLILREAKAMAGGSHYSLFLTKKILVVLFFLFLGAVLLFFLVRGRASGWRRRSCSTFPHRKTSS